jgi:hypothetical protein
MVNWSTLTFDQLIRLIIKAETPKDQPDRSNNSQLPEKKETAKVKAWQKHMRKFIKDTGLDRQRVRELI